MMWSAAGARWRMDERIRFRSLSVMMLVTNAPILTQIRALCGRKLLRRALHLSSWEHQGTLATSIIINTGLHVSDCCSIYLHWTQNYPGKLKTLHLSSWENRQQNIRVRGSKQTQSIDNAEKQEKEQAVTEWCHRDMSDGSPGHRGCGGSQFSRLLLQNRREKEERIPGHPLISWKSETIQKEKEKDK